MCGFYFKNEQTTEGRSGHACLLLFSTLFILRSISSSLPCELRLMGDVPLATSGWIVGRQVAGTTSVGNTRASLIKSQSVAEAYFFSSDRSSSRGAGEPYSGSEATPCLLICRRHSLEGFQGEVKTDVANDGGSSCLQPKQQLPSCRRGKARSCCW